MSSLALLTVLLSFSFSPDRYACSLIFRPAETLLIDISLSPFLSLSFFLRVSLFALIWQLAGIVRWNSFAQRKPTAIRFKSIMRGRRGRYRGDENVARKRPAGIGEDRYGINSLPFRELPSHCAYLADYYRDNFVA